MDGSGKHRTKHSALAKPAPHCPPPILAHDCVPIGAMLLVDWVARGGKGSTSHAGAAGLPCHKVVSAWKQATTSHKLPCHSPGPSSECYHAPMLFVFFFFRVFFFFFFRVQGLGFRV